MFLRLFPSETMLVKRAFTYRQLLGCAQRGAGLEFV